MTTGLKEKRTKIGTYRAPSEIRENTKARRAWNAAKIAELTAEPGVEAKVVGKGGYEEVSVYRVTQVEGRIQYRGTCQVCARQQAVEGGAMVLHGYERPGDGWITGRCWGTGLPPAEVSIETATSIIQTQRALQSTAQAREAEYATLIAGFSHDWPTWDAEKARRALCPTIPRTRVTRSGRTVTEEEEAWTDLYDGWNRQKGAAGNAAWRAKSYADALETHVIPRFGQPLYEVVMA